MPEMPYAASGVPGSLMMTRTFFASADAPVSVVFVKALPAADLRSSTPFPTGLCNAQPALQSNVQLDLFHFLQPSGLRSADANTLHGPASLATCTSKLFAAACHSITTAFTRARFFNSSVKAIGPVPPSAALR